MNDGKKRWLTVLPLEDHMLITDYSKKYKIKGSEILVAAWQKAKEDPEFLSSLAEVALKAHLQELNDEAMRIESEKEQIRRQFKELTGKERIKV